MSSQKYNATFAFIVALNFLILFYSISQISLSYAEAKVLYDDHTFLHFFITAITRVFGSNDYAVRIPFLFIHMVNLFLLYKVSYFYLTKKSDRIWAVFIYALLPGVNSAAILINTATLVIFATLSFVYAYLRDKKMLAFVILIFSVLIDNSMSALYLSLIFFSMYKRDNRLLVLSILLFAISMYVTGGINVSGKPSGHFAELLGVYGAIFSPLVFIFFFYSLYRILIKEDKNILWFISFGALIFSLLLSFRQRLYIEDFAPFVVISVPFLVKIFFASYRIRLPQFRKNYQFVFYTVIFSLVLMFLAIHFNKTMYYFYKEPQKHFAYKHHYVKELSKALAQRGISGVHTSDRNLQKRLKFYRISDDMQYPLTQHTPSGEHIKITISYTPTSHVDFYVSKIHKK